MPRASRNGIAAYMQPRRHENTKTAKYMIFFVASCLCSCISLLFVSQGLRGIEARRLARWIDRGHEADQNRGNHHQDKIERQDREWHVRYLIDVDRHPNHFVTVEHERERVPGAGA